MTARASSSGSFQTTTPQRSRGTVFGEQYTYYTNCTCQGTCEATCYSCGGGTCNNTCGFSCDGTCGYTCYSCDGSCDHATCWNLTTCNVNDPRGCA